jgi:hypothetical protein
MSIASFELGHNLLSIDIWSVIVGNGNGLRFETLANSQATILYASKLATYIIRSACAVGRLVGIAAWTIVDLALVLPQYPCII